MVCCQLLLHVNHSCMHAFKYGPETVWGAKDAAMNKIKFLPLWSLHLRGIINSSKYICSTLLCGSKMENEVGYGNRKCFFGWVDKNQSCSEGILEQKSEWSRRIRHLDTSVKCIADGMKNKEDLRSSWRADVDGGEGTTAMMIRTFVEDGALGYVTWTFMQQQEIESGKN